MASERPSRTTLKRTGFFLDGPISVPLGFMMEGRAWFPIDMAELESAMSSGEHRKFADKSSKEFNHSQKLAVEFLKEISKNYSKLIIGGFSQGAMLASHVFNEVNTSALALFSGDSYRQSTLCFQKLKTPRKLNFSNRMALLIRFWSSRKQEIFMSFSRARGLKESF